MYKIKYITTGHVFLLPEEEALRLKKSYPEDYIILEKDGKKYKDTKKQKLKKDNTIKSKVIDC